MTKTKSTDNGFSRYFFYKLLNGRFLFFISAALSVGAFFQYALVFYSSSFNIPWPESEQYFAVRGRIILSRHIMQLSLAGIFLVAVFSAFSAFELYLKPHKTDMLASMPISHKSRFFADLLSGYSLFMAPFVLFSGIAAAIFAAAEKNYCKTELFAKYSFYIIVAAFFALSLLYALAVLAASICGRMISAAASLAILVAASSVLIPGVGMFIARNITGLALSGVKDGVTWELSDELSGLTPSGNLFSDEFDGYTEFSPFTSVPQFTDQALEPKIRACAAANAVNIAVWTGEIAVILAGAFVLTKFRKAERTGGAFGYKYAYYAGLAFVVALAGCISQDYASVVRGLPIIAIISGLVFVVAEICMRRGWKNFGVGAGVLAGSFCVVAGTMLVINQTGVFGLRNRLPADESIASVQFDGYTFMDSADIVQLRKNHSDFLKKYGNSVQTANAWAYFEIGSDGIVPASDVAHRIKYVLKDGGVVERSYHGYDECQKALEDIPKSLDGYGKQVEKFINMVAPDSCSTYIKGVFGGAEIKPEKISGLLRAYADDNSQNKEKGEEIGEILFYAELENGFENIYSYEIYENYTKTLEYAKNPENTVPVENDENTICYSFSYDDRKLSEGNADRGVSFVVDIRKKDLSSPKVKELLSFVSQSEENSSEALCVISSDWSGNYVYISTENEQKCFELLVDIISTKCIMES